VSIDLVAASLWLDLPPARKLVLVALCDRADGMTGECWPGRKEVAARASLAPRNVSTHFKALEEDGWIRSGPRSRTPGQTTTRWVNIRRIKAEGEGRRERLQTEWRGGDESSPHGVDDVTLATGGCDADGVGCDADDRDEGTLGAYEPSVITVSNEPSIEPSDDPPLSLREVQLRKHYAEAQRNQGRR